MEQTNKNFSVVDLVDNKNGRYLGQALYCEDCCDCPIFTINNRLAAGELLEAFTSGAKYTGADINLYHINMPIEINSVNTPYNEIRNTIVEEMKIRNVKSNSKGEQEYGRRSNSESV